MCVDMHADGNSSSDEDVAFSSTRGRAPGRHTHMPESPQELEFFVEKTLKEHPEWVRTATVQLDSGRELQLLHVIASSSVVVWDGESGTTELASFDDPLVRAVGWKRGDLVEGAAGRKRQAHSLHSTPQLRSERRHAPGQRPAPASDSHVLTTPPSSAHITGSSKARENRRTAE